MTAVIASEAKQSRAARAELRDAFAIEDEYGRLVEGLTQAREPA